MAEENPDALTQRLERLGRDHRRFKLMASFALFGVVAVFVISEFSPRKAARVVEAGKFFLLDPNRNLRGGLRAEPNGMVGLALLDASGKIRAGLAVRPDGSPSLRLFAQDDEPRATLTVTADGSPGLQVLDAGGRIVWNASSIDLGFPQLKGTPSRLPM